jgi:hypothetical protein
MILITIKFQIRPEKIDEWVAGGLPISKTPLLCRF